MRDAMVIVDGASKGGTIENSGWWIRKGLLFGCGQDELVDGARKEFLRPREEDWREGHILISSSVPNSPHRVFYRCIQ